jgi:hypothetical protein
MSRSNYLALAVVTITAVAFPAIAATSYTSEASFITAAGAAKASLPGTLAATSSFGAAPLTFSADAGQTFVIDTPVYGHPISGEANLLLSGYESQTLVSAVPLYAFGLKIFQPSNSAPIPGPNGVACYLTCDRGSFTITLLQGAAVVDSFTFTPVYDAVEFHGYAGATAFNRIRISDDLATADDEYFSTYRYSTQPVPELPTWAMSVSGLALLLLAKRRKPAVRAAPTAA